MWYCSDNVLVFVCIFSALLKHQNKTEFFVCSSMLLWFPFHLKQFQFLLCCFHFNWFQFDLEQFKFQYIYLHRFPFWFRNWSHNRPLVAVTCFLFYSTLFSVSVLTVQYVHVTHIMWLAWCDSHDMTHMMLEKSWLLKIMIFSIKFDFF